MKLAQCFFVFFCLLSPPFLNPFSPHASSLPQAQLDFKDPFNVTLEFGLTNEDQGPVLDANLPRSITKTVRTLCISLLSISLIQIPSAMKQKISNSLTMRFVYILSFKYLHVRNFVQTGHKCITQHLLFPFIIQCYEKYLGPYRFFSVLFLLFLLHRSKIFLIYVNLFLDHIKYRTHWTLTACSKYLQNFDCCSV